MNISWAKSFARDLRRAGIDPNDCEPHLELEASKFGVDTYALTRILGYYLENSNQPWSPADKGGVICTGYLSSIELGFRQIADLPEWARDIFLPDLAALFEVEPDVLRRSFSLWLTDQAKSEGGAQ